MSKTAREVDHIDAIAMAIASISPLAAPVNPLHERARASLVERAVNLAGFVIVPKEPNATIIDTLDTYMPGPTTIDACEQAKDVWRKVITRLSQEPKP